MKFFKWNYKNIRILSIPLFLITILFIWTCHSGTRNNYDIRLNDSDYFEARGFNVMVFSNRYNASFDDSKMSGIEIIHHDVRTATNGDVRLSPTPAQWDPIPVFGERKVDK